MNEKRSLKDLERNNYKKCVFNVKEIVERSLKNIYCGNFAN